MKKSLILILTILGLFSTNLFSQPCGTGILRFNIFTPNGSDLIDFSYEILPVSDELFNKLIIIEKLDDRNSYLYTYDKSGVEISQENAEKIINLNDKDLNGRLNEYLAFSNLKINGKVKDKIEFKTFYSGGIPVILKINAQGKSIYILGNFFGGCGRYASLVWSEKFTKLY